MGRRATRSNQAHRQGLWDRATHGWTDGRRNGTGGARRGHAKSKRSDLRVVGLAVLVSETGHVPLLHRTYPGNGSDQAVLSSCLAGLGKLHDALDNAERRSRPACRTLVRDGGSWSEQLELDLG